MVDPWRESDPRWQPYAGPVTAEAEFGQVEHAASDLYDFLREAAPVRKTQPPPPLPQGVYLQQTSTGWALFVPSGSAGYVRYDGDRQQLLEMASGIATV